VALPVWEIEGSFGKGERLPWLTPMIEPYDLPATAQSASHIRRAELSEIIECKATLANEGTNAEA
jgi:hypothetical protein